MKYFMLVRGDDIMTCSVTIAYDVCFHFAQLVHVHTVCGGGIEYISKQRVLLIARRTIKFCCCCHGTYEAKRAGHAARAMLH